MADGEVKLTVWFTNDKRGLVLNKTNNRTIRGCLRRRMRRLVRQDHRAVSDHGRLPRQDGARLAGEDSAAEGSAHNGGTLQKPDAKAAGR